MKIFTDYASGASTNRPELAACLDFLQPGNVLTVWRIDRLGRSTQHVIDTVTALADRGVQFRSLTEQIDTTTAAASWSSRSSSPWRRWNAGCCPSAPAPA